MSKVGTSHRPHAAKIIRNTEIHIITSHTSMHVETNRVHPSTTAHSTTQPELEIQQNKQHRMKEQIEIYHICELHERRMRILRVALIQPMSSRQYHHHREGVAEEF